MNRSRTCAEFFRPCAGRFCAERCWRIRETSASFGRVPIRAKGDGRSVPGWTSEYGGWALSI
jgi:hypothetical protein